MKRNFKSLAMGFFDDVFNNDKDKKKKSNSTGGGNNANPLANFGKSIQKNFNQVITGQPNSFGGQGQSLGGSKPGVVIEIILPNPGPVGVRVEKRSTASASAIVNHVIPQSQADHAGLQRGDVICFAGSNGQQEMQYDMFLQIAKSTQRPIYLEARRFQEPISSKKKAVANAAAAAANSNTNTNIAAGSADVEARRKAMMAAVDAREKAHKQKTKPTKKYVTKTTLLRQQELQLGNNNFTSDELKPQSEESRQAAIAAKRDEINHANELGYNPYAAAKSTAGQARNATVTTQHGEISSSSTGGNGSGGGNGGNGGSSIPVVAPPSNSTTATPAATTVDAVDYPLPEEFEEALVTIVSSSAQDTTTAGSATNIKAGLKIARTLITNATNTSKGQQEDIEAGAKFRKVRLENPKIKAAIVDIPGTIQLLFSVGFQLMECEENQESVLLFPSCQTYTKPEWLSTALRKMEQQEKLLLKTYYNKHRTV